MCRKGCLALKISPGDRRPGWLPRISSCSRCNELQLTFASIDASCGLTSAAHSTYAIIFPAYGHIWRFLLLGEAGCFFAALQLAYLEGRNGASAFRYLSRGLQVLASFFSKLLKMLNDDLETSAFVLSCQNSWFPARTNFAISHFFINVVFINDYERLQCRDQ